MNIKPEQIPDEVVEAAMRAEQEFYAEKRYTSFSDIGSTDAHHAMKSALAAALPVLLGEPRAWVVVAHGKDQWATTRHDKALEYGAGDHPDEGHLVAVYALPTLPTQDTPNEQ